MAPRKLARTEWKDYFDTISKKQKLALVQLEVVGSDIGDQMEIRWQPLRGLTMDPKRDSLAIVTEDLDHAIAHPKDIFVEEKKGTPETIEIIDQDNNKQIIRLRMPSPG